MMGDPVLFLEAGVACLQGWTMEQAREQPLEDLLLLFAFKSWESDELRDRQPTAAGAPPSPSGSGGRTQVTTTEFTLRPKK